MHNNTTDIINWTNMPEAATTLADLPSFVKRIAMMVRTGINIKHIKMLISEYCYDRLCKTINARINAPETKARA
jgi:hypothetical protein